MGTYLIPFIRGQDDTKYNIVSHSRSVNVTVVTHDSQCDTTLKYVGDFRLISVKGGGAGGDLSTVGVDDQAINTFPCAETPEGRSSSLLFSLENG